MQLGTMSNMLRGLPMQAATTNMYQAAPNAITQGIGAVGAYGALNGAFGGTTGRKEGGVINAAKGGIMSYDVGGEIESTLENMDVDNLKKYAKESSSPSIKKMAARLIQEKSMPVPRMARGGILAFAKGEEVEGDDLTTTDVGYSPDTGFNGALTRLLADRHAESFKTKPVSAPPPAPSPAPTPAPEPSPFAAGPDVNPTDVRLANSRAAAPAAPVAPSAPPAPPPAAGITAAPAAAPVARPPATTAAPAGIKMPAAPGYVNAVAPSEDPMFAALRAEAAKTPETQKAIYDRQQKDREAIGLGPNQELLDYRSKIMAERANLDDDAKRQKNLRLAEFFASWGSTPGATLVAGMTAFKKSIPTMIEDEKERKKVLRETDKLIYDLGQTERLEKKGNWEEAGREKANLAERGMKINEVLGRYAGQREQTLAQVATSNAQGKSHLDAATYNAQMHLRGQELVSAAHKEVAAAQKDATNFSRIQTALTNSYNAVIATEKYIESVRSGKEYQAVKAKLDQARLLLQNDANNKEKQKNVDTYEKELSQYDRDAVTQHKQAQDMYNASRTLYQNATGIKVGGEGNLPPKSQEALEWANANINSSNAEDRQMAAQIKKQLGK
jgi:hypothetical protein